MFRMLTTLLQALFRPRDIPNQTPQPPILVPAQLQVTPVNQWQASPIPYPQYSVAPTNPLSKLTGTIENLGEDRIPVGTTVRIAAAISPLSKISYQHVSQVTTTESTSQSLPYGPGAHSNSPRLFGGANFGG